MTKAATTQADKAAGILKARKQGDSWSFYCPVHQTRQFNDPETYPYSSQDKPDAYILPDGDKGYPRYKCGSRSCDEKNLEAFLAPLTKRLGVDLVWSAPKDRSKVMRSENEQGDDQPPIQLPSEEKLAVWTGYLLGEGVHFHDNDYRPWLSRTLGVTDEQIRAAGIGLRGFHGDETGKGRYGTRLLVPLRDHNGELKNLRLWDPFKVTSQPKMWLPGSTSKGLFGIERLELLCPEGIAVITEGESDWLAALTAELPALGNSGGAGAPPPMEDLRALAGFQVVIVYDNDDVGRSGTQKLASALNAVGATPYVWDVAPYAPEKGGDLRDALLADAAAVRTNLLGAVNGAPWSPLDAVAVERQRRIDEAAERIAVQEAAKRLVAASAWTPPMDKGSLADQLATPPEPVQWIYDNLTFHGANVTVIAEAKAGKSALVLNVVQSLVDNEPLFGHFAVQTPLAPGRRVAWWNAELSESMAVRWLRDLNIQNTDRVVPHHLRGAGADLTVPAVADWAVGWLRRHNVSVWVLDPMSALFTGEENSATEVGAWLRAVDQVKDRAGVETVFLVHHSSGTVDASSADTGDVQRLRGRGSTRLTGWTDVQWTYTGRGEAPRYLAAMGRDVDLAPFGGLLYRSATRRLYWDGSARSPKENALHHKAQGARRIVQEHGKPMNTTALKADMNGKTDHKLQVLNYAVDQGWLTTERVGSAVFYNLGPVDPDEKLRPISRIDREPKELQVR